MIECVVLWFNRQSGEGWVQSLEDRSGNYIYACNIKGKRTWYESTACVYYAEGEIVNIEVDENGFLIGHTPGIFDSEKWNKLDQSRLAFKCDEQGKAINGLF